MVAGAGGAIVAATNFLVITLRRNWGRKLEGEAGYQDLRRALLDDLAEVKEDLSVLRDADRDVAVMRFVRGVDLMIRESLRISSSKNVDEPPSPPVSVASSIQRESVDSAWREDLLAALDSAEHGYHRVKTIQEKIMCFEIMCSCFLLVRPTESAMYSILNSIKVLLREKKIENALSHLRSAVKESATLKLEECEVLELLFSRVCGIVSALEKIDGYAADYRDSFREVFRQNEFIKEATEPDTFVKWNELQVYKHTSKRRIIGATAHAVVPVVPTMAAVGTILTAGYFRPKNAGIGSFDTVPLKDRKNELDGGTLYDFRWHLVDLAHCQERLPYSFGRVSLKLDSSSGSWTVVSDLNESVKKLTFEPSETSSTLDSTEH